MKAIHIFLVILILMAAGPAAAKLYRYQDAQGVLHFTNDRTTIPEGVIITEIDEVPPSTAVPKKEQYAPPAAKENPARIARRNALLARKTALDEEFETLAAAKAELAENKAAILRHPRSKARKRHKVLNRQALELNARIRDYEQRRQAFNREGAPYNITAQQRLTEYENTIQR